MATGATSIHLHDLDSQSSLPLELLSLERLLELDNHSDSWKAQPTVFHSSCNAPVHTYN
jgi:hypothetical protein